MKNLFKLLVVCLILLSAHPVLAQDLPNLQANAHIENIGWEAVNSDENHHLVLGRIGAGLRLEAITLDTDYPDLDIVYMSHVQDIGWQENRVNGQESGTTGQSKKIEAVAMYLDGNNAPLFDLWYRAQVEGYGWLGWTKDYGAAGTVYHNWRCEALEIIICPKGSPAPGSTVSSQVYANSRVEATHLALINRLRLDHGLDIVSSDLNLKKVADARVKELPTRFSHFRPNGKFYETIVKDVFPNFKGAGGGIIENINFSRAPQMTDPVYSFELITAYPDQLQLFLNPAVRYVAWSAIATPTNEYGVELLSGLDRIDFAD